MVMVEDAAVSRVISRDGTEIGYWTAGKGPPLVLMPGAVRRGARGLHRRADPGGRRQREP